VTQMRKLPGTAVVALLDEVPHAFVWLVCYAGVIPGVALPG
jgi:hypothetical protein